MNTNSGNKLNFVSMRPRLLTPIASTITLSAYLLSPFASAQDAGKSDVSSKNTTVQRNFSSENNMVPRTVSPKHSTTQNNIFQQFNFIQEYDKLQQSVQQSLQQPIQNLSSDLNQGITSITGEVQSQINAAQSQIAQIIAKTVGALGFPDLTGTGQEIKNTLSAVPTSVLSVDATIQAENGERIWRRDFTVKQADKLLGVEGQQQSKQERVKAQNSVDISTQNAQAAQSDYITQEIAKKQVLQIAELTSLTQQSFSALQQQNQLTAIGNVNLSDISNTLSLEQRRQQLQTQGRINAIFSNTVYTNALWQRDSN